LGERKGRREKKEKETERERRREGKRRVWEGIRKMGKRRKKEGAGEGRDHQLIFAIICDTALLKCWI